MGDRDSLYMTERELRLFIIVGYVACGHDDCELRFNVLRIGGYG